MEQEALCFYKGGGGGGSSQRGCHLPQKKAFVFNTKIWKWKIIIMLSNKMKYQINALVHDNLKNRLICFETKSDKAMSKSF